MFLRNVGMFLQVHMQLQPRRPTSTIYVCSSNNVRDCFAAVQNSRSNYTFGCLFFDALKGLFNLVFRLQHQYVCVFVYSICVLILFLFNKICILYRDVAMETILKHSKNRYSQQISVYR
jgi:hypothetical protein